MSNDIFILLRFSTGYQVGLGHFTRCLSLAQEFERFRNVKIHFATDNWINELIKYKSKYRIFVKECHEYTSGCCWLNDLIHNTKYQVIIFDHKGDLCNYCKSELKDRGTLLISIDDPSDKRLDVDINFYPPISSATDLCWDGMKVFIKLGGNG